MSVTTILIILLLLLLLATIPAYPYSRNWGYRPVSLAAFLVVVVLILMVVRVLPGF